MSVLAIAPALPLHAAGKYVAGAYVVFVLLILVYVTIMAVRLGRMERQLVELNRDLAKRDEAAPNGRDPHRPREASAGRHRDAGRTADPARPPSESSS
jgi:hypothetical protein